MKGFGRIILNAATALSFVLCVATIVLWVRSHTRYESYKSLNPDTGRYVVWVSLRGGLQVANVYDIPNAHGHEVGKWPEGWGSVRLDSPTWASGPPGEEWQEFFNPFVNTNVRRFGLRLVRGTIGGGRFWSVRVPFWCPALASSILPAVWIVRRARLAGRRGVGFFPSCGYDLRATPERCPECGRDRLEGG